LGVPEGSAAADTTNILATEQSSSSSSTDLTTQLFNADGSLKQDMDAQAKFRQISIILPDNGDDAAIAMVIDGKQQSSSSSAAAVQRVTYQLPEAWSTTPPPYVHTNTQQPVCRRITVMRVPNPDPTTTLKKATQIGVAKALQLPELYRTADLVGGRTVVRKNENEDKLYYEFDLAVAPTECDPKRNDNLGLGLFCPYDTIALVSATTTTTTSSTAILVLLVESDPDQWKQANADLRRIRSSFTVLEKE
jgi:hypothetical protein